MIRVRRSRVDEGSGIDHTPATVPLGAMSDSVRRSVKALFEDHPNVVVGVKLVTRSGVEYTFRREL